MAKQKRGRRSFAFDTPPRIAAWASVAGKKESEGPLQGYFDYTNTDTYFGEPSWEKAECRMQQLALETLLEKAGKTPKDVDMVFSGDLLNQCISSSFALRNTGLPALGLYGACSTMAESLLLASLTVGGGFADRVVAMTSSHFAASERQYRYPLGYGGQRTPTAQWTVTGSGAALVSISGQGPVITAATVGTIEDLGIADANNMGAAMAPAAFETIRAHLDDLKAAPEDFDLIVTGDLGKVGSEILLDQFQKSGVNLGGRHRDCGTMVFDLEGQDVHAGGSGCGCSAIVLCGYLLDGLVKKKYRRILFCGTGALLSPTSSQQGESIPGVCHAVSISAEREG
ncbi:MAG: stage V sporulation protein AD [Candidatus Faecousia sp.]|nr:stage V sporulation protein AD [Clostridiales bacterium]MDD7651690.1 stage V sporulation protein AD [Bacillota bacterium]MDY4220510.1 stage V sporulation protein AD [Candidatus Faecousia sp.]